MIPVATAREQITGALRPVGTELVGVAQCRGRVLAEDMAARISHPVADVSAMDGYAVRAADAVLGATLAVVGESAAGHPWSGMVETGKAVRIFTGAHVPAGADTVVIQEDTTAQGNSVRINEAALKGRHVRPAAQDFRTGDTVLRAPRRLSFRDVGLLSAMNIPWVPVYRQPRVAVLSTGDEVVMPGDPVGRGQLVSANGPSLCAFINQHGGHAVHLGIARDDDASLRAMATAADGMDLIVTSGGVSVGDHDLVGKVLGEVGLDVTFHKIAMRPGKPLMFGRLKGTPFIGLPGNPVSAMVGSILFLGPALAKLQGLPGDAPATVDAILEAPLKANDKREDYLRASLRRGDDGRLLTKAFVRQDSAVIREMADAQGLIVRAPLAPEAQAGNTVRVIPLGE